MVQVVIDAADPELLSAFWAMALGYVVQPPPEGFDDWDAFLGEMGVPQDLWHTRSAVIDPDGVGPRVYFQQVPEPKSVKNRVHLDVRSGDPTEDDPAVRRNRIDTKVEELTAVGARMVGVVEEMGEYWVVLQDPEGNEFCVT
jgi:Glyoxalase-like domain